MKAAWHKSINYNPHENNSETIISQLHTRRGKDQLIMFLTGLAGAGKSKSTAVKVAQHFCIEFCLTVAIIWTNMTFYFTDYTGSAVPLSFIGVTIFKVVFLNSTRELTLLAHKDSWKDARILIINKISFMKDCQFQNLDKH